MSDLCAGSFPTAGDAADPDLTRWADHDPRGEGDA